MAHPSTRSRPTRPDPDRYAGRIDRLLQYGDDRPRWFTVPVLGLLLVVTWLVVHAAGGTHSGAPHIFYITIALATVPFGVTGALSTAAIAAALMAQAPLDTGTGQPQTLGTIAIRTAMFLIVGTVTSAAVSARRRADQRTHFLELRELIGPSGTSAVPADPELVGLIAGVVDRSAFHTVFQPIYSLHDGELLSVEALTRFHPEPYRAPDKWFAAADEVGLGQDLELAAIATAIAASVDLPGTVSLSLNVSPGTLADPRLHEVLKAALGRPLILEITEHAVIKDYHLLEGSLTRLRAAGVRIAVDDAGAGFASLHHIVELSPDIIKLDISLTQNVKDSPARRALGGALIDFVHDIGAMLIVEGVEDEDDLDIWAGLGADAVQGYLVGRPALLGSQGFGVMRSCRVPRCHRTT